MTIVMGQITTILTDETKVDIARIVAQNGPFGNRPRIKYTGFNEEKLVHCSTGVKIVDKDATERFSFYIFKY